MRLHFLMAVLVTALLLTGVSKVFGQTMPQQQNCTTTTSGSISHTFCGPPVIVQVQAPAVTVQPPAVTVQPAPVVIQPPPAPPAPAKKVRD